MSSRLLFGDLAMSPEFRSVYGAISNAAEGVLLVVLCRPTLWDTHLSDADETEPAAPQADGCGNSSDFWALRSPHIATSWTGYGRLGDFVNENLIASLIAASLLYLLRGLLRELVGVGMRSELLRNVAVVASRSCQILVASWRGRPLRFGWPRPHRPILGCSAREMWRWSHALLTGFASLMSEFLCWIRCSASWCSSA